MGANYTFHVKSKATYAPAFLMHNNSVLANMKCKWWHKVNVGLGFELKGCLFDQEYQTVFCWVNTNLQNVRFVHVEYNIDSLISNYYEISAKFLFFEWFKKNFIRLGEGPDCKFLPKIHLKSKQ